MSGSFLLNIKEKCTNYIKFSKFLPAALFLFIYYLNKNYKYESKYESSKNKFGKKKSVFFAFFLLDMMSKLNT